MIGVEDDRPFVRAGAIIAHSRIAAFLDIAGRRVAASLATSRTRRVVREWIWAFHALSGAERAAGAIVTITVAVLAHLLMASLLPSRSAPMPALSAAALLGASLAAVAASVRNR
jgi:hypothetical protein